MALLPAFHRSVQRTNSISGRITGTYGTVVTAGTAIHTLGSTFTQLISSAPHDTFWLTVGIVNTSVAGTRTDSLVNIYAGASGSEQMLIPSLLSGWAWSAPGHRVYQFPLYIPAGTRLSAKMQALISADTSSVYLTMEGGGDYPLWAGRAVDCLGVNTAGSMGTVVPCGSATEGSFTAMGTLTRDIGYVLPMIQGTHSDINMSTQSLNVDVGIGGAAVQELSDFGFVTSNGEMTYPMRAGIGSYYRVPSGTTLQLRSQSKDAFNDVSIDAAIYGVY